MFFFFQAEDGIRDGHVTGVQTCALPICAVDDRAEHLTGEPALADLEAVGDHVIDPGARGQRVDHLVEAARDQGGDPPGRTGPRHQLERPVRGHQGLAHLLEHGFLETFEQRDPGPQRLREVELAAHRGSGDLLDPVAHAGMLGDQFDDLLGEERGIDIGDEQSARPLGDRSVHGSMTVPFPITVIPDSVTTQPRARSAFSSRPIWVRGGITTFLSMMARWIWQWRPTETSSMITESETDDQEFSRTPGDSTELDTWEPETTTPGEMIESTAEPTRVPGPAWTNFAGGTLRCPV